MSKILAPGQPGGHGIFVPGRGEPPKLGVFCRMCDWSITTGNPNEISAATDAHLNMAHPKEAAAMARLRLLASVDMDELGKFIDSKFATVPPPELARAFQESKEQLEQDREIRKAALMDLIQQELAHEAEVLATQGGSTSEVAPLTPTKEEGQNDGSEHSDAAPVSPDATPPAS